MKILVLALAVLISGCTLTINSMPDQPNDDTEFKRQVVTALQAQDQKINQLRQEMVRAKAPADRPPALDAMKKKMKDKKANEEAK